ncbi:MAG: histidine phosphatase family protein [Actinobacteria bacterium]|nr:histidine phosphatase family protein [Actinomycetota bacterium]
MSTPKPESDRTPIDRAFLTGDLARTEIVLVRHGQQNFPGPDAPIAAWRDPPLTDLGHSQALAAGRALAAEDFSAVYSSQLQRAHDTGLAVAQFHSLEVTVLESLEEIHMFGDLEPTQHPSDGIDEIEMEGARRRFSRELRWDTYPYTESGFELRRRVSNTLEGLISKHPGERSVGACHGGVINAYIAAFLGINMDMFFRPAHASIHRVLARNDRRVVSTLNELHHLMTPEDILSY